MWDSIPWFCAVNWLLSACCACCVPVTEDGPSAFCFGKHLKVSSVGPGPLPSDELVTYKMRDEARKPYQEEPLMFRLVLWY